MSLAVSSNRDETELIPDAEHPRHKRRRRGKKRKSHRSGRSISESEINENADNQMPDAEENKTFEKDMNNVNNKRRPRGILIRPINVPQAPKNSTQFIIDDHEGCGLYVSFETPNPYFKSEDISADAHVELCGAPIDDDAFQDIDYKYESLKDLADDTAYSKQDFEAAYKTLRYEELLRLDKKDLVAAIGSLDTRLEKLEEELLRYDPNSILEQVQHQLLDLQEENTVLVDHNSSLKGMLSVESNESASEQSLEEELSGNEADCTAEMNTGAYIGNVDSASEQSDDGNLSENEGRPSSGAEGATAEGQNMDAVSVELVSEQSLNQLASENAKTEYNAMSEKMSNVGITEPLREPHHV